MKGPKGHPGDEGLKVAIFQNDVLFYFYFIFIDFQ